MKFDFDKVIKRRDTNAIKWDFDKNALPMWVADMDFEIAPCIQEALKSRLAHPIFGYNLIPQALREKICTWWAQNHGVKFTPKSLIFSTGVVPALSSMIRALTKKNDKILVQSPVYHVFFRIIKENSRKVVENPLVLKDGVYSVDFRDLERKFKSQKPKLMILCNPHNPVGKVFSRLELEKIAKLAKKHGVMVISDEIHCDITQIPYTSFYKVDESAIITLSATKAFNLAGLCGSFNVIKSHKIRHLVDKEFHKSGINDLNAFIIAAQMAAFSREGRAWLKAMNAQIAKNKDFAFDYIEANSECKVIRGDALYMIWVQCFCKNSKKLAKFLREKHGVLVSSGSDFKGDGKGFLRLNLACPSKILKEGLKRFVKGVRDYKE